MTWTIYCNTAKKICRYQYIKMLNNIQFVPNSRGNKAAANLRPTQQCWTILCRPCPVRFTWPCCQSRLQLFNTVYTFLQYWIQYMQLLMQGLSCSSAVQVGHALSAAGAGAPWQPRRRRRGWQVTDSDRQGDCLADSFGLGLRPWRWPATLSNGGRPPEHWHDIACTTRSSASPALESPWLGRWLWLCHCRVEGSLETRISQSAGSWLGMRGLGTAARAQTRPFSFMEEWEGHACAVRGSEFPWIDRQSEYILRCTSAESTSRRFNSSCWLW